MSPGWKEVKDRLEMPGSGLSGGQQQRLCIARAIAVQPEVLLMDEPCSALDPISTLAIEDLINELKTEYTIVIVTHNMQQAARVSDYTGFFNIEGTGKPGKLVEMDETRTLVGTEQWVRYHAGHTRAITRVVAVPWLVQAMSTAALLIVPSHGGRLAAVVLAALALVTVVVTVRMAVPAHARLAAAPDPADVTLLLRANLARTLAWTGSTGLATTLLV